MCRKVKCNNCSRPTWAGCGQHIESALAGVPNEDRCPAWKGGSFAVCTAVPKEENESGNSAGGGGVLSWLGF